MRPANYRTLFDCGTPSSRASGAAPGGSKCERAEGELTEAEAGARRDGADERGTSGGVSADERAGASGPQGGGADCAGTRVGLCVQDAAPVQTRDIGGAVSHDDQQAGNFHLSSIGIQCHLSEGGGKR